LDRGLSYGDGVFETIRFVGDRAPLWHRHMQRLKLGCQRLQLPIPDVQLLQHEAAEATRNMGEAVLRITMTRGTGERGYAQPSVLVPTRIVAAFPLPVLSASSMGIHVRVCATRYGDQPLLAGIKHLNRLEQVLARAEWHEASIAEGLMCDVHDNVISATAANLFAVIDDTLVTPRLDRCGVAGVSRAEVLERMPACQIRELPLTQCLTASELFLTSSIRGILPVRGVGDTVYAPGPVARALQQHWRELGFPTENA
jgi:4-amino-4-deoxychorismate lyase